MAQGTLNEGGRLTILHSVVVGNQAVAAAPNGRFADSGGLLMNAGSLNMGGSVVAGNGATLTERWPDDVNTLAIAGGIHMTENASAFIGHSDVSRNRVTVTNSAGFATAFSGGIHDDGALELPSSVISHNAVRATTTSPLANVQADSGAGEMNSVVVIENSRFTDNQVSAQAVNGRAYASAGAIVTAAIDRLVIRGTVIEGNRAIAECRIEPRGFPEPLPLPTRHMYMCHPAPPNRTRPRNRQTTSSLVTRTAFVVIVVLLTACGCDRDGATAGDSGATALPFDTAQDWVTYTDYVVEVTVVSERAVPTPASTFPATARGPAPTSTGDEYLSRLVTATTSSTPVWSRPTLVETRHLPDAITVAGGGWTVSGTGRKPSKHPGRPEVGRHYLAAITYADITLAGGAGSGPPEWLSLALLPFDDGAVGNAPAGRGTPMWRSIEGKDAAEVAAILERTPADPAAAPYMDEDPVQRYQDVAHDTVPTGTPAPGEF